MGALISLAPFESEEPKHGDIVLYHGEAYYFEPCGTSCRLYDRENQIGIYSSARCTPSRYMVTKAPLGATVIFRPTPQEAKIFEEFERMKLLGPLEAWSCSDESYDFVDYDVESDDSESCDLGSRDMKS